MCGSRRRTVKQRRHNIAEVLSANGSRNALDGARPGQSIAPHARHHARPARPALPLPALKTRKALTRLAAGDRLVVECTDPLSTLDIPNLINQTGDVLEDQKAEPGLFVFRIRKRA